MEDAAEIGRVLEPDTTGNHADAVVGPRQQLFGLVLIGLGLIERDGLAIMFGAAIGLIGTVLLSLVVFGVAHELRFIIRARHLRFWK